jgi:hypothetical protein
MRSCVFPVEAAAALAWSRGRLSDVDLVLDTALTPQAVYVAGLPDKYAWRGASAQMVRYWRAGAVFAIWRTGAGPIMKHLAKWGAVPTYDEPDKRRFLLKPDDFARFMKFLERRRSQS